MTTCRDCGEVSYSTSESRHLDWCPTLVKGIVLERRWADEPCERYIVPADDLRDALNQAWLPSQASRKRRPTRYNDTERYYNASSRGEQLWEYPYNPGKKEGPIFRYELQTNNKDTTELPGYGRIMATEDKHFRGFSFHPPGERRALHRAPEIRESHIPFHDKLVEYPKGGNGESIITRIAPRANILDRSPRDYERK